METHIRYTSFLGIVDLRDVCAVGYTPAVVRNAAELYCGAMWGLSFALLATRRLSIPGVCVLQPAVPRPAGLSSYLGYRGLQVTYRPLLRPTGLCYVTLAPNACTATRYSCRELRVDSWHDMGGSFQTDRGEGLIADSRVARALRCRLIF